MTLRSFTLFLLLVCFAASTATAAVVVPPVTPAAEETALAAVADYKASLKEMTGKERRQLKRQQRRDVRDAVKAHKQGGGAADDNTILLVILAILLPPVAVLVHQGELNSKFWIALILTLLFYLPGLIYALLVIFGNT